MTLDAIFAGERTQYIAGPHFLLFAAVNLQRHHRWFVGRAFQQTSGGKVLGSDICFEIICKQQIYSFLYR